MLKFLEKDPNTIFFQQLRHIFMDISLYFFWLVILEGEELGSLDDRGTKVVTLLTMVRIVVGLFFTFFKIIFFQHICPLLKFL